jgi:putative NADH-flavin reductase
MKIVLYGSRGTLGQHILKETLVRGHPVTIVLRKPALLVEGASPGVRVIQGDALDPASVTSAVAGSDVVISAIGPSQDGSPEMLVQAAKALVEGVKQAGAGRLLVVGGAGSLQVAPGKLLLDSPEFNPAWRPTALAHKNALEVYRRAPIDWTFLSPASWIGPGPRTGHYRTGLEDLLVDADGQSRISIEDFAVALLDEVEHPAHLRQRFTVGY